MHTLVTAFFDIGRDSWKHYNRTLVDYLAGFRNVLRTQAPLVVFVGPEMVKMVEEVRCQVPFPTITVGMAFEQIHMYRHFDRLNEIQADPNYATGHPNPVAPEVCKPYYNAMVANKMAFLHEATVLDPNSDYFIWIDAGFTHNTVDLSKQSFDPTNLTRVSDRMTFTALEPVNTAKNDPREFFLQYHDAIVGGVFGGPRAVIRKVYPLYYDLVAELLDTGIKDDDQYYNTLLAKRYPNLVRIIMVKSWYQSITPSVLTALTRSRRVMVFVSYPGLTHNSAAMAFLSLSLARDPITFDELLIYNSQPVELPNHQILEIIRSHARLRPLLGEIQLLGPDASHPVGTPHDLASDLETVRRYLAYTCTANDRVLLLRGDCVLSVGYLDELRKFETGDTDREFVFVAPTLYAKPTLTNEQILTKAARDEIVLSSTDTFHLGDLDGAGPDSDFRCLRDTHPTSKKIQFASTCSRRTWTPSYFPMRVLEQANIANDAVLYEHLPDLWVGAYQSFAIHQVSSDYPGGNWASPNE